MPTRSPDRDAVALLVGHAVGELWASTEDPELGGCCPQCCGPCSALKRMLEVGTLDWFYDIYVDLTGATFMWDADKQEVDREWLTRAWSVNRGCHDE